VAKPVAPVIVPSRAIVSCINQAYERGGDSAEQVIEGLGGESLDSLATALEEEPRDLLEAADEAPIIKLVNSLLFEAATKRASDIHIEPFERDLLIRYRIDGVLYNVLTPPKRLQASIISRIKIMGGLNIAEKRLPQDGRISIKIAGGTWISASPRSRRRTANGLSSGCSTRAICCCSSPRSGSMTTSGSRP
jgi:general secretion pathway protein E